MTIGPLVYTSFLVSLLFIICALCKLVLSCFLKKYTFKFSRQMYVLYRILLNPHQLPLRNRQWQPENIHTLRFKEFSLGSRSSDCYKSKLGIIFTTQKSFASSYFLPHFKVTFLSKYTKAFFFFLKILS